MAIVQYQVMYRYINPATKNVCTNSTATAYGDDTRFIKDYLPTDALEQVADMADENAATNPKYDMLFCYNGVIPIETYLRNTIQSGSNDVSILVDSFTRCNAEGWFVASTHASLGAALKSAEPIVKAIGKDNVKLAKLVPLNINVGIE